MATLGGFVPAAAAALEPLRERAPRPGARVPDRVLDRAPAAASAAADLRLRAPDGQTVTVRLAAAYAGNAALAQSYVDFLGSLVHGRELGKLTLVIVPFADIASACGAPGQQGIIACYGSNAITIPGEEVRDRVGVSTSFALAHEYGHHVAAHRSNAPFQALDFGPKYWSSHERVCAGVAGGQLAGSYESNPGEAWAEAYARLRYPQQPWTFAEALRPGAAALRAARRDVTDPWKGDRERTFRGRFPAGGRDTRSFSFDVRLDGRLDVRLNGPRDAELDLELRAGGERFGASSRDGSRDRLTYKAACRERPVERVTVIVKRRSGRGAFSVRARYAG